MKKKLCYFFLLLVSLTLQAQTAMLQSNGTIRVFEGSHAFEDAYLNATDGDVVVLSAGQIQFANVGNMAKQLHIIGAGAFSTTSKTSLSVLHISADNAIIEGMDINSIYIEANQVCIRSCNTQKVEMWPGRKYSGTRIEGCCIPIFSSSNYNTDLNISNSTIGCFDASGYYVSPNSNAEDSYFVHCVIYNWHDGTLPREGYDWDVPVLRPAGHYQDCVLGVQETELQLKSPNTYHGNLIYNNKNENTTLSFGEGCENSGNTTSTFAKIFANSALYPAINVNVLGSDGTNVGIWGGSGFSRESPQPSIVINSIGSMIDQYHQVRVNATCSNAVKLRYWWNDDYADATDIDISGTSVRADVSMPMSARGYSGTPAGVAELHITAVNSDEVMAAPENRQVRYAYGITPTVSTNLVVAGRSVTLKWTNTENLQYTSASLYYSKNNGPFILWAPNLDAGMPIDFYGESDSNYRFIVVAQLKDGTTTSLDKEWAVSIGVE